MLIRCPVRVKCIDRCEKSNLSLSHAGRMRDTDVRFGILFKIVTRYSSKFTLVFISAFSKIMFGCVLVVSLKADRFLSSEREDFISVI